MKKIILYCSVALLCIAIYAFNNLKTKYVDYKPKDGYVPDEQTAIKIAEAIWFPIYGSKIYDEKPYKVKLINKKIWVVEGTLKENLKGMDSTIVIQKGGVAYIEINKEDCKILKLTHGN